MEGRLDLAKNSMDDTTNKRLNKMDLGQSVEEAEWQESTEVCGSVSC